MTQTFEQKVKAMSADQIIMALVDGLKKPKVEVRMRPVGEIRNDICYGSVATCTVLQIAQVEADPRLIKRAQDRAEMVNGNWSFVITFEYAIDCLRKGNVAEYNKQAKKRGFALIQRRQGYQLPILGDDYTLEQLARYEQLAEIQYTGKPR